MSRPKRRGWETASAPDTGRFEHRAYSKGFSTQAMNLNSEPDFSDWWENLDDIEEKRKLIRALHAVSVRQVKRELRDVRKEMGRRPFNQALAAWLSGNRVGDGKRRRGRKRNAARRGDSTE